MPASANRRALSVARLGDEVRVVDPCRHGQVDHGVEHREAGAVHEHVGAFEELERRPLVGDVEADGPRARRVEAGDKSLRLGCVDVRHDELRNLAARSEIDGDGASHLSGPTEHDDAHDERPRIAPSKARSFQPNRG